MNLDRFYELIEIVKTADHEEPSCCNCEDQDKCDGEYCGPEYGWSRYYRVIENEEIKNEKDKK